MKATRGSALLYLLVAVSVLPASVALFEQEVIAATTYLGVALALVLARNIRRLPGLLHSDNADVFFATLAFGVATAACLIGLAHGIAVHNPNLLRLVLMGIGAACLALPTAAGIWVMVAPEKTPLETARTPTKGDIESGI